MGKFIIGVVVQRPCGKIRSLLLHNPILFQWKQIDRVHRRACFYCFSCCCCCCYHCLNVYKACTDEKKTNRCRSGVNVVQACFECIEIQYKFIASFTVSSFYFTFSLFHSFVRSVTTQYNKNNTTVSAVIGFLFVNDPLFQWQKQGKKVPDTILCINVVGIWNIHEQQQQRQRRPKK